MEITLLDFLYGEWGVTRDESLLTVSLYRKEDNRLNAVCIARLVAIEQADTLTRQLGTKATTYCVHRCQFVHHSS